MHTLKNYLISSYAFHSEYTIQNNVTNTSKGEVKVVLMLN